MASSSPRPLLSRFPACLPSSSTSGMHRSILTSGTFKYTCVIVCIYNTFIQVVQEDGQPRPCICLNDRNLYFSV